MTTLPTWIRADETKPAPGPLLLVQAFVNTWEGDTDIDLLAGDDVASGWLREAGLAGPHTELSAADVRRAREIRESLRALLVHNGGGPPPTGAQLAPLHELARASRPRLSLDASGGILLDGGPGGSLAGGLARLLLIVRDAQQQGTWSRLKACRNPECCWAFYDRSHAHRGAWCDMATCGNMIKNRNFRARRR